MLDYTDIIDSSDSRYSSDSSDIKDSSDSSEKKLWQETVWLKKKQIVQTNLVWQQIFFWQFLLDKNNVWKKCVTKRCWDKKNFKYLLPEKVFDQKIINDYNFW